ncbi:TetR/AcrR family transcriptional regulator [Shimia sediminis]|uniref:TetR/AcrR family transcriptional regulator n=1 Tax=Shimia sediminis TaxID=2497945 RepID=UPI000F8C9D70|nr:TetR/AcrR family transcriptional regulator [Shimia sediminis]
MTARTTPLLHRDNPDKTPLTGHVKVTREDWLNVARDTLVNDGVAEVKVLALAERLEVSRSSFYWYFKNRKDLLAALLDDWEVRNTRTIVSNTERPADNISEAVCNFFRCFVDPRQFDRGLDFAVREWSRRDDAIRKMIDTADKVRIMAVTRMFERHGYSPYDADVRARIIYFMQLGYHALEVREPMQDRMDRLSGYLLGFTGVDPDPAAVLAFQEFATKVTIEG